MSSMVFIAQAALDDEIISSCILGVRVLSAAGSSRTLKLQYVALVSLSTEHPPLRLTPSPPLPSSTAPVFTPLLWCDHKDAGGKK